MPVWQMVLLIIALLFALLSIFLWIWNVLRAKKMREQGFVSLKKQPKKVKLPFKLEKFISAFGGIDNIVKASAINEKIRVYIHDHDKVDFTELKKIKNQGIFVQSDSVSMVLGNYANELSGMVNDLITIKDASSKEI